MVSLLPHTGTSLMQENIVSQIEALEIAMKLESSLVRDIASGIMQIQSQLANLMVRLQDIKRGKEVPEEIWCTICKTDGHHKGNFSALMNYVSAGSPNTLNTQGMPCCRVCQTRGYKSKEFLYLQKIVSAPTSMYCKFCSSVGLDEKDYRALQLLQEKTMDTYLMKNDEKMQVK